MDKELASGEYFLKDSEKRAKRHQDKKEKQVEAAKLREVKRKAAFIPPPEKSQAERKKEKAGISGSTPTPQEVDVEKLKKKVKSHTQKQKKRKV